MEEKWWSKFQTKTENTQSTSEEPKQEETFASSENMTEEKESFFTKERSSKEVFDDAINFIQDLNVKIDKSVDEALGKDDIRKWINEIDEAAKNTADTIIDKGTEFINSQEVQNAAEKAKQVMNDVVNEVKSWSVMSDDEDFDEEIVQPDEESKESLFEDNNEIKKDIDAIKQAVNESISKKEVTDSLNYVKSKANEANKAFTSYLNKPEVIKTKEFFNDKVEDSKNWINEQMAKEEVADKVNYMKEKADDAKKWVYEVYHSEDVQEGIEKAKESMDDVAKNTRASFVKVVNDPRVQNGYVNAKESTARVAKNVSSGVKKGIHEMQTNESLAHELNEWKHSAVTFTKQSARLIGATANEIAHNEQVQNAASKGKEAIIKGANSLLDSLNRWAKSRQVKKEVNYLENNEEKEDKE